MFGWTEQFTSIFTSPDRFRLRFPHDWKGEDPEKSFSWNLAEWKNDLSEWGWKRNRDMKSTKKNSHMGCLDLCWLKCRLGQLFKFGWFCSRGVNWEGILQYATSLDPSFCVFSPAPPWTNCWLPSLSNFGFRLFFWVFFQPFSEGLKLKLCSWVLS